MATCPVEIRGRGDQAPAELISLRAGPAIRPLPITPGELMVAEPEAMPSRILLGTLSAPGHRVVKAIPVNLSLEEGMVVASWRDADEFGTGASMSSALEDLGRTVAELYESLDADKDRLGPDLVRIRGLLHEYVLRSK